MGGGHGFTDLVGDEYHAVTLSRQLFEYSKQVVYFLGRQHAGRLVEYKEVSAGHQQLDQLDLLPLAHGELGDGQARIDPQAVPLGQIDDTATELGPAEQHRLVRHEQSDVVQHRHRGNERKVLEDHPDAHPAAVGRGPEPDFPPIEVDRPRVGLVEAVDDLGQGALARPVLPQDRVDLPVGNLKADAVVGDDAGESLGYAPQFQHGKTYARPAGAIRRPRLGPPGAFSGSE